MAEHAAERGLIAAAALASVVEERTGQLGDADLEPTQDVGGSTRAETRDAVRKGELRQAFDPRPGQASPPNVVVETEDSKTLAAPERGHPAQKGRRRKRH